MMNYDEYYLHEFKRDYSLSVGGKYNLEVQVKHLARLAEFYYSKYQKAGDWTDCLKANGLYNSVSVRKPEHDGWREKIFQVQQAYWKEAVTINFEEQQVINKELLNNLQEIRAEIRNKVQTTQKLSMRFDVDSERPSKDLMEQFTGSSRDVSTLCTERMTQYVHMIMDRCVQTLQQQPPCGFTVVAIGSLARGEATPYSYVEYAFLIEKHTEETEQYFKLLAMTSYFLIGNLGETNLKCMAIKELDGWFEDLSKSGFKIDGLSAEAGNIPTGNGVKSTDYSFITTPKDLAIAYEYVMDHPEEESIKGDLTAMLAYTAEVYTFGKGGTDLLDTLKTGMKSKSAGEKRESANFEMLSNDMKKFNFSLDHRLLEKAYTVDVKRQLYRFPSIVMYDLSVIHQIFGEDAWDTAEHLLVSGKISADFYRSMMFQLAAACFVRLSAYLYHDSQDERVSTAERQVVETAESKVTNKSPGDRWYVHIGLVLALGDLLVPMKKHLSAATDGEIISEICREYETVADTSGVTISRISTLQNTGHTTRAYKTLTTILGTIEHSDRKGICDWVKDNTNSTIHYQEVIELIALIFQDNSHFHEALSLFTHLRENHTEYKYNDRLCIAACQQHTGNLEAALQTLLSAGMDSGEFNLSIGRVYLSLRRFEDADKHLLLALQHFYVESCKTVRYDYFGNPLNDSISNKKVENLMKMTEEQRLVVLQQPTQKLLECIESLAALYKEQYYDDIANQYYQKYQALFQHLYGDESLLPAAAHGFMVIGDYYCSNGDHLKASKYLKNSLETYHQFFGEGHDHIGIALLHLKTGENYLEQTRFEDAQRSFEASMDMYQRIYGKNSDHASIADVLHYSGLLSRAKGNYADSVLYLQKALKMYNDFFKCDNINSANVLKQQAITRSKTGEYRQAIEGGRQALNMFKRIHGAQKDHVHIARVFWDFGHNYNAMKDYKKAEEYYRLSLEMNKRIHGEDSNHPEIAVTLNNLGDNYYAMTDYKKAEEYHRLSLDMKKRIHGEDSDHPDIAVILNNLGTNYNAMQDYKKAEECYRLSLDMKKRIHGEDSDHPEIAVTLNNLGDNYYAMTDYKKAEEYHRLSLDMMRKVITPISL